MDACSDSGMCVLIYAQGPGTDWSLIALLYSAGSLTVGMPAFQAGDPGPIPGGCNVFLDVIYKFCFQ